MSINLSSYNDIKCALLVRMQVDKYYTGPGSWTQKILTFSDYKKLINYNGDFYQGIGNFVNITGTTNELKTSSSGITITISGIPSSFTVGTPNPNLTDFINSKIKGSPVIVYRALLNANNNILNIPGNPVGRFYGVVDNYAINEEWDNTSRTASATIDLICSSRIEALENKVAGRKTNPSSWRRFNDDAGMDRVPSLEGANFNFGAPK